VNLATLKTVARRKRVSQSELARLAGVSRQAVSKWFCRSRGLVQMRSPHLKSLANGLGVPADLLLGELPGLADGERDELEAGLLWDRAYPDLDAFLIALLVEEPRALGRLVETFGLFRAAKLVGESIWTRFPEYRRYVHPARRRGLEHLWQWRTSRTRT
jgi:transcriptional regulator with XRE-family HTH domain